ncbi:MAG: SDR family NAD(P)-dependent oxidoreductase [Anaerolineae bacterium]|jgi:dTDP-glucose 4,6-dehydratase|nr:SDR family NAD(P)-dependent oxidoreductase [Anaerolineae bacterium]MDX9832254.1 SDR family NAD(P)-dependent oxidoreductase [Anaerolineae bacterium]
MNWEGTPVLITGAGGFIGSHLAERLVDEGARVRAFVRYNSRHDVGLLAQLPPDLQAAIEVVAGDLRDGEAVRAAMAGIDVVFHLGALIAIPYSYLHPREVVETNVLGTLNVLMAARDLGTGRVVHTSTSEVYGTARYTPIDEAHSLQGQSPYSASKIGADKIAESFYRSFDLPVTTLRPFNTYGPRQSARAVIPTIITQALVSDHLRLGALEPRRDFAFVTDTVDAFLRVGSHEAALGQEINAGSGSTVSIGELAIKILGLVGRELPIVCEDERLRPPKSEVMHLHADAQKARELIGWQPRVSLDQGLRRTIDWIREHLDLYRPGRYEV